MVYKERTIFRPLVMSLAAAGLASCAGGAGSLPGSVSGADVNDEVVAPAVLRGPSIDEVDLIGKTASELDATLGAARLTRAEGAGELRTYELAGCSLLVLLKRDGGAPARAEVLYAGRRVSSEPQPDLTECLSGGRLLSEAGV